MAWRRRCTTVKSFQFRTKNNIIIKHFYHRHFALFPRLEDQPKTSHALPSSILHNAVTPESPALPDVVILHKPFNGTHTLADSKISQNVLHWSLVHPFSFHPQSFPWTDG